MPFDNSDRWLEVTPDESRLMGEVSQSELMANTTAIARWTRLSGSAEEAQSVEYVRGKLEEYGLDAKLIHHDAYISLPLSARLLVESPVGTPDLADIDCITHSCGVSTPPEGVAGELVYVGHGAPDDYAKADVRGKIVLVEGLAGPEPTKAAEEHGAVGHIHINDAQLHEMTISPVWGSPEILEYPLLPKTPAISIREQTGGLLKELLAKGPVRVRMHTSVDTGWRKIPLLIGDIRVSAEPGRYVLLSGHIDSWHKGAMDNGSANATMLEVARLLAANRHLLRRGLKLAFWSGHSHGRYAGSAWFADEYWSDIHRNCVAHVNVDSTGAVGATVLGETNVMAEASDLAAGCVRAVVPDEEFTGTRFGRAGDQSFWGHGVPSLYMSMSQQPASTGATAESFAAMIGAGKRSGGLGWFWHSVHDTIDKIDPANLVRDTKVYVLTVLRLCACAVLPLDYRRVCDEMRQSIRAISRAAHGPGIDIGPVLDELDRLQMALEKVALVLARLSWQSETNRVRRSRPALGTTLASANDFLMAMGRALIPVNYVGGSRFRQDPALSTQPMPALARAAVTLAKQEPGSDEAHSARITFVRERARIIHGLETARLLAASWLAQNEPHR